MHVIELTTDETRLVLAAIEAHRPNVSLADNDALVNLADYITAETGVDL